MREALRKPREACLALLETARQCVAAALRGALDAGLERIEPRHRRAQARVGLRDAVGTPFDADRVRARQAIGELRHARGLRLQPAAGMHQAPGEVIEQLRARVQIAAEAARQPRGRFADARQQRLARRADQFRGGGGRGRARVGGEVGDGEVGLVADAAHHRNADRRGSRAPRASSLNAHRSSMLPPPRTSSSTSHSARRPARSSAATISPRRASPCTDAG